MVIMARSRWRVGALTVARLDVATTLAVVITVTVGTFWLMYVPVAFLR